ncbi:MAG: SPFH domain-containing protein, partial [Spirochaetaceae bacterium]|nr:SPFH domain-containing protein [Spirochaetaceae bacterium]
MRNVGGRFNPKLSVGMVIAIIAVIALVVVFSTSFFVVDQTERAVITTFGKFTKVADPGLHFKFPFGVQQNYNVKTEVVQTEQFGFRTEKVG